MTSSFDPRPFISTGSVPGPHPVQRAARARRPRTGRTAAVVDSVSLRIGVVGLGVMGRGIAASLALAGHRVVGYDLDADALRSAEQAIVEGRYGIRRLGSRPEHAGVSVVGAIAALDYATDLEELSDADLIIESIPEDLALKMELFARLDAIAAPHAVLASNSSGLSITALALATGRPAKVLGWHWSSPAAVMPFAEIVRSEFTDEATVQAICDLARGARKNPVVVRDHPQQWGFVANRVYFAMIREALRVVEDGVASREEVDQLMVDCFNWPVGPLTMLDGALRGWEPDETSKEEDVP